MSQNSPKIVSSDSLDLEKYRAPKGFSDNFGRKLSQQAQDELHKVDANIRNAQQQSGSFFVS
jgi:hypothetical protein